MSDLLAILIAAGVAIAFAIVVLLLAFCRAAARADALIEREAKWREDVRRGYPADGSEEP